MEIGTHRSEIPASTVSVRGNSQILGTPRISVLSYRS